jgi:hypothetical protein
MPCRLLGLSLSFVLLVAFPSTAAALPALPIDEDVPLGPVDVPPAPSVDADVPPAAALPPLPIVALPPDALPAPTVDALWASASDDESASALATISVRVLIISNSPFEA